MDCTSVLQELESLGTEQNRKIYRRHGVGENQYGVSFANLKQLRKKLKLNHDLAQELWASGNHDAQILATMIANPQLVDKALLERWAKDLSNYVITDAFVGLVSQTPLARQQMEAWHRSEDEWLGRASWHLLAQLAQKDATLPDSFFEPYLAEIEQTIHTHKNRVREAMNNALIAIGIRNEHLHQKALAVTAKVGKVDVDHGETNCKTPDAAAYIDKAFQYKQRRQRATVASS
jgi:3-methyladenine DNA glycosylase AlkD